MSKPLGRPTEYDQQWVDDHVDRIPSMFTEGQSLIEVIVELDMAKETFYRLRKEYPTFSNAVELGLGRSEAWWTKLGRMGSAGQKVGRRPLEGEQDERGYVQAALWALNMKNRFGYSDKVETKNTNVEMSQEEWVKQLLKSDDD